jgi:PHD/YefM family antitoxin component YafN of YafNO toxin-antitoxin module
LNKKLVFDSFDIIFERSGKFNMNAITTNQAMTDLDKLVDQVIADMQPTILCNENGNKAVLISLDEFST